LIHGVVGSQYHTVQSSCARTSNGNHHTRLQPQASNTLSLHTSGAASSGASLSLDLAFA